VKDHDDIHAQRYYVHERGSALEDDGVRQFNVSRIALGFDASRPSDGRHAPYD
jgi:hypothetical protein